MSNMLWEYTTGKLTVEVEIESYTVERWNPSTGKDFEVECYFVEDVRHKGESIMPLITEEQAEDILSDWKKERDNGDY